MNTKLRRRIWTTLLCMGFASLVGITVALAEEGRNFAGFFSVTDVVSGVDEVTVSLKLEVMNFSGGDVSNATVRMAQFLGTELLYESLTTIDIAYRDLAMVAEPVLVVPRQDYEHWLQGGLPITNINYTDHNGSPRSAGVELIPMRMEGEDQR